MSTASLPGFRDFYPDEFAQRAWLFGRWRDVARRFGFVEYDGPPLEPLDLYTKKSGEEIVGQLYAFEDKGGRAVALRPEMTPTVARMVAARANALRKPVRWFSVPQLFRYERQQKGRLREHFQLNVDIFGEADVGADAELLAVACETMRACGLGADDVRARVSDRQLLTAILEGLGVPTAALGVAFAAIDKIDRDSWDVLTQRMTAAGVPADVARDSLEFVRKSSLGSVRERLGTDTRVLEALDRFERYEALLKAHGVHEYFTFDLTIVRGLAYYTGIVFELFDARGEFRAICGGGRYDTLLKDLAGVDLPALGFGMGDVVLGELLKARGKMPEAAGGVDVWVVAQTGVPSSMVVKTAAGLRRIGLSAAYVLDCAKLEAQKLTAQLQFAERSGASHALIVDGDHGQLKSFRKDQPSSRDVGLQDIWEATSLADYLQRNTLLGQVQPNAVIELLRELGRLPSGSTDRP
jgi:histidyl-tRNA synthetase